MNDRFASKGPKLNANLDRNKKKETVCPYIVYIHIYIYMYIPSNSNLFSIITEDFTRCSIIASVMFVRLYEWYIFYIQLVSAGDRKVARQITENDRE